MQNRASYSYVNYSVLQQNEHYQKMYEDIYRIFPGSKEIYHDRPNDILLFITEVYVHTPETYKILKKVITKYNIKFNQNTRDYKFSFIPTVKNIFDEKELLEFAELEYEYKEKVYQILSTNKIGSNTRYASNYREINKLKVPNIKDVISEENSKYNGLLNAYYQWIQYSYCFDDDFFAHLFSLVKYFEEYTKNPNIKRTFSKNSEKFKEEIAYNVSTMNFGAIPDKFLFFAEEYVSMKNPMVYIKKNHKNTIKTLDSLTGSQIMQLIPLTMRISETNHRKKLKLATENVVNNLYGKKLLSYDEIAEKYYNIVREKMALVVEDKNYLELSELAIQHTKKFTSYVNKEESIPQKTVIIDFLEKHKNDLTLLDVLAISNKEMYNVLFSHSQQQDTLSAIAEGLIFFNNPVSFAKFLSSFIVEELETALPVTSFIDYLKKVADKNETFDTLPLSITLDLMGAQNVGDFYKRTISDKKEKCSMFFTDEDIYR